MKFVDQYLHRPPSSSSPGTVICGSWGIIRYFRCDSSRISWLFRRGREVGLARPNLWLCGREELCGGRAPCQRRPRPPPPPPPRPMDLIRFDPCPQQQRRVVPNETTMGGKAVQPFRWKVRYREQAARARRGLSWLPFTGSCCRSKSQVATDRTFTTVYVAAEALIGELVISIRMVGELPPDPTAS
jgi:hypothetical protein